VSGVWERIDKMDAVELVLFLDTSVQEKSGRFWRELRKHALSRLAQMEPGMAARWVTGNLDLELERDLFAWVAVSYLLQDEVSARAWMLSVGFDAKALLGTPGLMARFAETAPGQLALLALELPESQRKVDLLDQLLSDWAVEDLDAAFDWAQRLPLGEGRDRAILQLGAVWEKFDSVSLFDFATQLPEGDDRLVAALANRWLRVDPEGVAQWASSLPAGSRRSRVLPSVVAGWAEFQPEAALQFADALGGGEAAWQARVAVVSALGKTAPEAMASWLQDFPSGSWKDYAIENLAMSWPVDRWEGLAEWVESTTNRRERELALSAGVYALGNQDPCVATHLAYNLTGDSMASPLLLNAVNRWLRIDPDSAKSWVRARGLPFPWAYR